MKRVTPHDPLDDLIAAALHGDLSPEERAQFESRLQTDPDAQAAYQEAKAMHDLLEQTNRSAQPDPDFEQRMVSAVRRKLAHPPHEETAWESLLILWTGTKAFFTLKPKPRANANTTVWRPATSSPLLTFVVLIGIVILVAGVALGPITNGIKRSPENARLQMAHQLALADSQDQLDRGVANPVLKDANQFLASDDAMKKELDEAAAKADGAKAPADGLVQLGSASSFTGATTVSGGDLLMANKPFAPAAPPVTRSFGASNGTFFSAAQPATADASAADADDKGLVEKSRLIASSDVTRKLQEEQQSAGQLAPPADVNTVMAPDAPVSAPAAATPPPNADNAAPATVTDTGVASSQNAADALKKADLHEQSLASLERDKAMGGAIPAAPGNAPAPPKAVPAQKPALIDDRKLIRNAQLDLEVKSYQAAFDQVTALTKAAGGYVDTSNSQRGGNGKLQGTVIVKVLPENLDAFLLKLHDLGDVQNQSVSTADVTKDYFDTQARIVNSQKMEEQLQELLKRENGKVSDLLAVEHELARVRGDIEQMQGQLKLYDFQVQFATVTMNIAEKDLNQTAAYVLKEQDNFSLYAVDVEGAYQKARAAADKYNGQVLAANLDHQGNGANQVGASLLVMVAPDQIESFLADIRGLGRVANFTRETERVAKDGGDSSQPADETKTEKDKVRVQLAIRSDNDSRKQVALVVVTKGVDQALEDAKAAALSNAGTEILNSALNTTPDGSSTAQISVRVPGKEYSTLMDAFRALGRQASVRIQRNDNNGPGSNGDDVPVIVTLALTDNDTPVQETDLVISAEDVDAQAQLIKKQAADSGVEIKSSTFQRQPDGSELAQMTLRLPLAKYPAFVETLKKAGEVNSLSVARDDRPDQARSDDAAPAEIRLQLRTHFQIVAENTGVWATLRNNFGAGITTLLGCITVIGVVIAFLAPWLVALVLLAWIGRRIYIWRRR